MPDQEEYPDKSVEHQREQQGCGGEAAECADEQQRELDVSHAKSSWPTEAHNEQGEDEADCDEHACAWLCPLGDREGRTHGSRREHDPVGDASLEQIVDSELAEGRAEDREPRCLQRPDADAQGGERKDERSHGAFMRAARERGDEFESPAWHHEIYHSTGPTKQDVVKADALLTYLQHGLGEDGRSSVLRYRLLELDRATEPTDKLATKLASYARLYRYTRPNHRKPAWQARYDTFPAVICVVAGKKSAAALERRVAAVLSLCDADPELRRTPQVELSFCLLGDLVERGPFAPIWQRPDSPDRYDWLGELASSADGEAAP